MITCKFTRTIKDGDAEITNTLEISEELNNIFYTTDKGMVIIPQMIIDGLWDKFEEKYKTDPKFLCNPPVPYKPSE